LGSLAAALDRSGRPQWVFLPCWGDPLAARRRGTDTSRWTAVGHSLPRSAAAFAQRILAALLTAVVLVGLITVSGVEAATRTSASLRSAASGAIALLSEQVALVMSGTFEPVVTPTWIAQVIENMVNPALGGGYTGEEMTTPEEFWPVSGLFDMTFNKSIKAGSELLDARVQEKLQSSPQTPLAVFGYSQSALIAAVEKRTLATDYANSDIVAPVSFILMGNPYRPNGGFLSRIPLMARVLTLSTHMTSTPTDTPLPTVDIARQYDVWADFPTYPLNLLSDINSLFGVINHWYLPESVNPLLKGLVPTVSIDPASPDYLPTTTVASYGDTTYYFIPSKNLPMFYPLRWIGLGPVVDVFEPLVRVFVELGYDRSLPAGQVVRARLLPGLNNLTVDNARTFVSDIRSAVAQGGQALVDLFCPSKAPDPASTPVPPTAPYATASPASVHHFTTVVARRAAVDVAAAAPARASVVAAVRSAKPRPLVGASRGPRRDTDTSAAGTSGTRTAHRATERN